MEAEAFPIRFTKGIRSYWLRRRYQRVDGGAATGRGSTRHLVRLGGSGGGGDGGDGGGRPWAVRLGGMFRKRVKAPATAAAAPARVLGRIRDAYVDVMLGVAKQQPAAVAALPLRRSRTTTEALWQKRVPVRRSRSQAQARQKPEELGQRLVMEMYKSVLASRDLKGMLEASRAR